jgi:hypothetical protein
MKKKPTIAEGIAGESYTALKDHFNGLQPAVSVPAFLHNKIWMIARKKLSQRKRSWQKVKDSQVRMIWLCSNAACSLRSCSPTSISKTAPRCASAAMT